MKTTYKAKGLVYGNYWGGGRGSYQATTLENDDYKALIKEAKQLLKSGGLDGGMGFESLIGALLDIETTTTTEIDGKTFTNREYEQEFIGKLTPKEEQFLLDVHFSNF